MFPKLKIYLKLSKYKPECFRPKLHEIIHQDNVEAESKTGVVCFLKFWSISITVENTSLTEQTFWTMQVIGMYYNQELRNTLLKANPNTQNTNH